MSVRELRRLLKHYPQDIEVELQVGGDGAVHSGPLRLILMLDGQSITLTTERVT